MRESRKSIRVDAQLFISYDILDREGNVVQAGMALSKDLSRKGVKMEERSKLPVDSSVQIHLAVGDEVVDLIGKVRHVEKVKGSDYLIGLEFLEIDEKILRKLSKFYPEIVAKEK